MSKSKIVNLTFSFSFHCLDLGLEVSMMLYNMILCHASITSCSYMIIYYKEHCRRSQNNDIIQYILYMLILGKIHGFQDRLGLVQYGPTVKIVDGGLYFYSPFTLFYFSFLFPFNFLFLEQLGLGFISHKLMAQSQD